MLLLSYLCLPIVLTHDYLTCYDSINITHFPMKSSDKLYLRHCSRASWRAKCPRCDVSYALCQHQRRGQWGYFGDFRVPSPTDFCCPGRLRDTAVALVMWLNTDLEHINTYHVSVITMHLQVLLWDQFHQYYCNAIGVGKLYLVW